MNCQMTIHILQISIVKGTIHDPSVNKGVVPLLKKTTIKWNLSGLTQLNPTLKSEMCSAAVKDLFTCSLMFTNITEGKINNSAGLFCEFRLG